MPQGYTGTILRVDLNSGQIEKQHLDEEFYRMYMGGGALGTYFLLKDTDSDTHPLSAENIVTIAPGLTTGALISGVSRCGITSLSPVTGAVGDSQVGGKIGPMIKRAGYDAIVITGKARNLSYLLIDGDEVHIKDASSLQNRTVLEVHDCLTEEFGTKNISVLQCGPAGENQVSFACLMGDLNDVAGRTGMGAVFGSKNLRAVVVRSAQQVDFADKEGLRKLSRLATERIKEADFPATLKQFGTPGVVGFQAQAGNLATRNYAQSFHPDYEKLEGQTFEPQIGSRHTTCPGCVVGCRKTVKAETPYKVTDRLGGPEFETLGLLGSNLDITDPVAVARANELCNNYGIDTITMGGLAAYVFECMENGLITPEQMQGRQLGFGDVPGLLWLIEQVVQRQGVGDILAQGFSTAIKHFGEKTAAYAIHVKNAGLAVHMAQVKPSQSLMYAACPIGPDHMSCEHDWLLASASDFSKALGIIGRGKADSTGLAKVRMTVYSQYFYSLLDSLCLCMFCWGPGNLYNYRDLEDLLRYTTGWDCSLWELMKVGQRRVNMMRQLNAKRGFTRDQDKLPTRLTNPLSEGPAQGRCVEPESFSRMLDQYYTLMGWDLKTGNPTEAVLLELGLEWTLEA
jgi:aldehyde:ferredoxin oxidoreductase